MIKCVSENIATTRVNCFFFIVPHRSLFRSKNRSDSFPKTNSSRSSSVASGGDSGIDDDLNRSGRYHQA